jgi:16S rRNA (cytosine967-C5)-methyltransferase
MLRDFRTVSFRILNDVFISRRWAKESIEANMKDLSEVHSDIKKVYELVYGIMRNRNYIDYCLSKFINRPNEDIKLQNILRIGYYQLKYMDSIPPYAAIDTCVQLAKDYVHPKTSGFINAVLRNIMRSRAEEPSIPDKDKVKYLSVKYSYEEWMIKFLVKNYGDAAEGILKAGNEKPPVFLRVNTLKTGCEALIKELKKQGVETEEVKYLKDALIIRAGDAIKTAAFEAGLFYVQDLSSQLLGSLVDAGAKDGVIDIGSAPGGKAAYFSISMNNKGQIIAIEPKRPRIAVMERNFLRLGITNVEIIEHDATVDIEAFHNRGDKVLVDAPCSALGVIRRHPEKRWCMSEAELKDFPKLQSGILENVKSWVKKGGELFYSTCTLNPAENEAVVEKFLDKNSGFKLEDITGDSVKLKAYKNKKFFQSLPGNMENMDGFFIAKMVRK